MEKSQEWNDEQWDFIHRPLEDGVLMGIPGGGKTRSIIGRVIHLVQNRIIPEKNGFMILTFSRLACRDFLEKGTAMAENFDLFSTDNVRTIHSLAGHIHKYDRLSGPSSVQTIVARSINFIKENDSLRSIPLLKNVSVIFVDEAQDVSNIQYEFVRALGEKLGPVVMVGDPNQSIYGFQGGDSKYLMNHPGWKVTLKHNYRSTSQIVQLVNCARPISLAAEMKSIKGSGPRPCVHFSDESGTKNALLRIIGNELENCAIIGPVRRSLNAQGRFTKIGLQWAANVLSSESIPFQVHYNEGEKDGSTDRKPDDKKSFESGKVHLLTVHGSKGLEFDTVILLNFHHNTMGFVPSREDLVDFECLWYVGLSRAKNVLHCMCMEDQTPWKIVDENRSMFEVYGSCKKQGRRDFANVQDKTQFNWKELLNNRKIIGEVTLMSLENDLILDVMDVDDDEECSDQLLLPEWDALSMMYGEFAENVMEYAYKKNVTSFFEKIRHMIRPVDVFGIDALTVGEIRKKYSMARTQPFTLTFLSRVASSGAFSKKRIQSLIDRARNTLPKTMSNEDPFHIHTRTETQFFDVSVLESLVKDWTKRTKQWTTLDIWKMTLFLWQYENEAKYRWIKDVPNSQVVCEAFRPFADRIQQWAASIPRGCEFHVRCDWSPVLPIAGEIDFVDPTSKTIVEFKFSKSGSTSFAHAMQVAGYTHMISEDVTKVDRWNVYVWNLYDGVRSKVIMDPEKREDVILTLKHALSKQKK